ncbi:Zn ribbon containing protein [Natrarchaeobaculum sulfurireducens]|uniref:Zn ribbon containing protein n=1 Tax=Natrarchaeobaculum sulfurireducens TaxID=2044521 RepID=A0A346PGH6_9EURY|nr:Zn ribbon containing protein [Natrarchaeobaculum sulfurireducens]AXR81327.1 Zn ribbon containing protein [Natrarchaeobaculum sulfurireducens]
MMMGSLIVGMEQYEFRCPACATQFPVDSPVLDATVENGCPLCGQPVSTDHFVPC